MAFRKLIENDCGRENALSRIAGHFGHDAARLEQMPFNPSQVDFQNDFNADQLVHEFMQEAMVAPQTFRMDNLLEEMREIENQRHVMGGPILGPSVKETLHLEPRLGKTDQIWAEEYINNGSSFNESVLTNGQIWSQAQGDEKESFEFGLGPQWAQQYLAENFTTTERPAVNSEGEVSVTAHKIVKTLENDPNMQYSKFVKFMEYLDNEKVDDNSASASSLADQWANEFIQNKEEEPTESGPSNLETDNATSLEFWKTLEDNWKKLAEEESEEHSWLPLANEHKEEYKFASENAMREIDDPLTKGKEHLAAYDTSSAVLCFEAACQKDPESVEAWLLLGLAQSENEQDPLAIQALHQCLRIDPNNLKAIQALAISQTNENYQSQACNTLIRWLKCHPKYSHLVDFDPTRPLDKITSIMTREQYKMAEELLLKAVNMMPSDIDSDVQTCLGVLFNLSGEFEKAVDCFQTALQVTPEDARLWNRLGATLANSGRSNEAVDAYHRALQLNPGFIRARYNVGVACINLKSYMSAAEHFIEALNLQAKCQNPGNIAVDQSHIMSDAVWATLRMCCNLMGRHDLRLLLDSRDLMGLNRALNITSEAHVEV